MLVHFFEIPILDDTLFIYAFAKDISHVLFISFTAITSEIIIMFRCLSAGQTMLLHLSKTEKCVQTKPTTAPDQV